jgi:hypothetical protein
MTNHMVVRVNRQAWNDVRNMLGGKKLSDSKRSVFIKNMLVEVDLKSKLKFEESDTRRDKMIKRALNDLL